MTEVRLARRPDARALAELRYAFRSQMAAPEEPRAAFLERVTAWLAERLEGGAWTAWVACARDQPVGLVLAHVIEKVPNPVAEPESLGYVSGLYVRPGWRGSGTGEVMELRLVNGPQGSRGNESSPGLCPADRLPSPCPAEAFTEPAHHRLYR